MSSKNGVVRYTTLEQLRDLRPVESDVEIDGRTYRCRGLTSGELDTILRMVRADPLPLGPNDDFGDRSLTVCFGLLMPDLSPHDDIVAARAVVDGMEPLLRDAIARKIRALTWGPPETASEQDDQDKQSTDHNVGPEHDAEQADAGKGATGDSLPLLRLAVEEHVGEEARHPAE